MRPYFLILFISLLYFETNAQNSFDVSLNEVSTDITNKLSAKNKKKIVVLFITDINKATTVAGKYIADILSVNIVNSPGNFEVFDRDNLSSIAEAKKLIAEGYIDVSSAQQLGKLLSVDAILVGNYTVLNSSLKLSIKAIDVNSGLVIAASLKDLAINADVSSLLGINGVSSGGENNSNRGFNAPLNSNEQYNNPGTVGKDCEVKKTGDYCFSNNTQTKLRVSAADYGAFPDIILSPGQTQCIYNKRSGAYEYRIYTVEPQRLFGQGEILIEFCKSKTFIIK